jgi:3-deoxy-D-manno-octulosonic-acid transferase
LVRLALLAYDFLWLFWLAGWILVRIIGLPFWGWQAIGERLGYLPRRPSSAAAAIWVHAASIGELLSARPVLAVLKKRYPAWWVLVTTTQQHAYHLARTQLPEADRVAWLPWDFGPSIGTALRRVRPDSFVLVECELWPNLIARAVRCGSRVTILNGRIYERDLPRYRLGRWLFAPLLQLMAFLGTQSEEDRRRFLQLGSPEDRTIVMRNTKYDVRFSQISRVEELRALLPLKRGPLWILASTHADEETQILSRCRPLLARFPELQLLIAPRHIDRARGIEATAKRLRLDTALRSRLPNMRQRDEPAPTVILLDTVGELPFLLELADLVFIGGSLVDQGGHNPIEAGLHRKAILIGPSVFNFAGIVAEFLAQQALIMVRDAEDLMDRAGELLADSRQRQELGDRAAALIRRNTGAAETFARVLERLVNPAGKAEMRHAGNRLFIP